MNIYRTEFTVTCPVNQERIKYRLIIQTGMVIPAEDIRAAVEAFEVGLHEDIADQLLAKFGGSHVLKARHHGVDIVTIRPHLAHWQRMDDAGAKS